MSIRKEHLYINLFVNDIQLLAFIYGFILRFSEYGYPSYIYRIKKAMMTPQEKLC